VAEDGKKTYLFIINDSPYGSERPYNALRLAMNLAKLPEACVQVFLMGDGVNCAVADQKTPNGCTARRDAVGHGGLTQPAHLDVV
jgi:uncharacterized protein involved in oxidation of intracellular sulfur